MVLARDYIEQLKIRYNASKGVFLLVQTQFEECQGLATIANECQLTGRIDRQQIIGLYSELKLRVQICLQKHTSL